MTGATAGDPYYRPDLALVHHRGFGSHAEACAPGILALLQPVRPQGGVVLELGCGSGLLTRALVDAGHRVIATDASPAMLALARDHAPGAEEIRPLVLPDEPVPRPLVIPPVDRRHRTDPDRSMDGRDVSGSVRHRMPGAVIMGAMHYCHLESPIERILLVGRPGVLTGLYLAGHHRCPAVPPGWTRRDDVFADARAQLDEYFAGTRTNFDLAVETAGTPFQRTVWQALREIPYGETWSYGELAARIGRPGSSRAVGAANGRNPVSIVVPCHRVIGADGTLTGYGWGTERKAWLLTHERRVREPAAPDPLMPVGG